MVPPFFDGIPSDIRAKIDKYLARIERYLWVILILPDDIRESIALGMMRTVVGFFNATPFDTVARRQTMVDFAIGKLELDEPWEAAAVWVKDAGAIPGLDIA